MTCGIPTPPAELRLNAVLSRREPGTTPGIVPLPGMRAKDDAEGSRNATPSELAAKEMPPGPEIAVDRLFGPTANAATQVVPR